MEFFRKTSQATDPNLELELHRNEAIAALGGHVHIVKQATAAIPVFDDDCESTGYTFIVASKWKLAPPEPEAQAVAE